MTYKRKTTDLFIVQSDYGYGQGFEDTTYEDSHKLGRLQLACYRSNQPEYKHRLIVKREKITNESEA
jgi:hypothetical protein